MLLNLLICLKKNSHTYILARYCCILKEYTNVLNIFKIMSYCTNKMVDGFFGQFVYGRHFAEKKNVPGFVGFFFYRCLKKNDETIQCMVDIKILSRNS